MYIYLSIYIHAHIHLGSALFLSALSIGYCIFTSLILGNNDNDIVANNHNNNYSSSKPIPKAYFRP